MEAAPRAACCAAHTRRRASPDETSDSTGRPGIAGSRTGRRSPAGSRSDSAPGGPHRIDDSAAPVPESRRLPPAGPQPRTCSRERRRAGRDEPVGPEDGFDAAALTPQCPRVSHRRTKNGCEESAMRVTTWAVLGSLLINLVLGLLVAAVFSVAPSARAAERAPCAVGRTTHATQTPDRPAVVHRGYLVAVRMGWGAG